jgi:hypothetical protein
MKAQARHGWLESKLGLDSLVLWAGGVNGMLEIEYGTGDTTHAVLELDNEPIADFYATDLEGEILKGLPEVAILDTVT